MRKIFGKRDSKKINYCGLLSEKVFYVLFTSTRHRIHLKCHLRAQTRNKITWGLENASFPFSDNQKIFNLTGNCFGSRKVGIWDQWSGKWNLSHQKIRNLIKKNFLLVEKRKVLKLPLALLLSSKHKKRRPIPSFLFKCSSRIQLFHLLIFVSIIWNVIKY